MAEPTYRYLGLEPGGWPGCSWSGLAAGSDHAIRLAPLQGDPIAQGAAAAEALAGAAGVGVAQDGTIYLADPDDCRILEIACDGTVAPYGCLTGPGAAVGQLDAPRAVLVGPRDALYIADTGNQRVVVVDRATGVVTGVLGGFVAPVDLAADASGRLYVADELAPAVVRFSLDGTRDASFAPAVRAPRAVAMLAIGSGQRLLVVDGGPEPALRVFDLDGVPDATLTEQLAQVVVDDVVQATTDGSALYVAGPGGVLAFTLDGTFLGPVADIHGAASGLALDCQGRLVVAGGGGIHRLDGVRRSGFGRALLGPIPLLGDADRWDRAVLELLEPLPDGAHLRIWTLTTPSAVAPPLPPEAPSPGETAARTGAGTWRAAPLDADTLVLHEPAPFLWICLDLLGDGEATPAVRAVRVDFLAGGLPAHLPEIYNRDDTTETVWRLVNLLAAPLDELDEAIADLPRLFDPEAVPDRETAPWLDALAVWVAEPLETRLPADVRRNLVAEAFVMHGTRGTRANFEAALTLAADAPVTVVENAADASLWQLGGDSSTLGFTTMLAPFEAQGAVVGTTADVDRSHLIHDADVGWPLYSDVAHRFCVHVAATALASERRSSLVAAIETEKPAHTVAHLCIVEPRTSIGFQCRVGIDMVVGGDAPTLRLGGPLDGSSALLDVPRWSGVGSAIDESNRVGRRPALLRGGP
jgi:phage tail-like protein